MTPRVTAAQAIGFAEVPDFHVAAARRADPRLEQRPVLVGGDPQKRGKVVAASADLQELGVELGMPLGEALDRAPDAVWVQTDMAKAREVSGLLRAAVRQEIESIELDGLAGCYWAAPVERDAALELGQRLQKRVESGLSLELRVGVAPVRFVARWVAEDVGARGVRVLREADFDAYLLRQPLERFPGVGPKTAARLAELGATDVASLRELGLERLGVLLGHHGRSLWVLACGEDPKPLRTRRHPTTLSREKSFTDASPDPQQIATNLSALADHLGVALSREGLGASRIALRLTFADSRTVTRSRTFSEPVAQGSSLASAARELLDRTESAERPIRKLGLVVAGLEIQGAEDRQLQLF